MTALTPAQKAARTREAGQFLNIARSIIAEVDAKGLTEDRRIKRLYSAACAASDAASEIAALGDAASQRAREYGEEAATLIRGIYTELAELEAAASSDANRASAAKFVALVAERKGAAPIVATILAEWGADDNCACGCTPCRCDETFAECDNPEVEHPGRPCNHYTDPAPAEGPEEAAARELADTLNAHVANVAVANGPEVVIDRGRAKALALPTGKFATYVIAYRAKRVPLGQPTAKDTYYAERGNPLPIGRALFRRLGELIGGVDLFEEDRAEETGDDPEVYEWSMSGASSCVADLAGGITGHIFPHPADPTAWRLELVRNGLCIYRAGSPVANLADLQQFAELEAHRLAWIDGLKTEYAAAIDAGESLELLAARILVYRADGVWSEEEAGYRSRALEEAVRAVRPDLAR